MGTPRRAMIVTGEASGDLHGGNLISAARSVDPDLSFFGVGGPKMEAAGCEILIHGEEIATMGLVEVIGHLPVIKRAFNKLKAIFYGDKRPDILILIDFPEFNLRLARHAKEAGIPVLYYVSPQVWAWRQGRVKKIARVVDHLAAIFPFEPEFYSKEDIKVDYVGNPLLDEFAVTIDRESFLKSYGLDPEKKTVGLFPGSRKNELNYISPTIFETAALLKQQDPELQFLLPVASTLDDEIVMEKLAGLPIEPILVHDSIYDVANACDAVITVSGTATLQTGLVGTPMVILYRMNPISFAIGKRLVKVPFIGLANIVSGQQVAREFIQDGAIPADIAVEVSRILNDATYGQELRTKLATVRTKMGEPGCSERVARIASAMSRGDT